MNDEKGYLLVNVYVDNIAQPVENARVRILGENTNLELFTNESGQTEKVELLAPNVEYSLTEQTEVRPYSIYTVIVSIEGLTTAQYDQVEIYAGELSIQDIYLTNETENLNAKSIVEIDPPTLWGEYPKTVENEFTEETAPYVLKEVMIPETIIVHDGIPSNQNANSYIVPFTDYIKNVACSEIYSTWPRETIKANVLAIISFTLNRIYTEWYISKGYDFTITSTTTYDQKYTRGRTIFASIADVVDEIFTTYIKFPSLPQPLLAHYRSTTEEAGYLSQWGSKYLGDQGYKAYDILRYYYGNVVLATASTVEEYPYSYPGKILKNGDCDIDVQVIQNQLNYIRGSYPAIRKIAEANGYFGDDTTSAVKTFQNIFSIVATGIVDFATWYRISYIYVSVKNMLRGVY